MSSSLKIKNGNNDVDIDNDFYLNVLENYGLDLKNKSLYLKLDDESYVNKETYDIFLKAFSIIKSFGIKNVNFYITGNGGDLDNAFGIYDIIKSNSNTIKFVNYAIKNVISSSSVILLSSNYIVSHKNCYFLLHKGSVDISVPVNSIDNVYDYLKTGKNYILDVYSNKTHTNLLKKSKSNDDVYSLFNDFVNFCDKKTNYKYNVFNNITKDFDLNKINQYIFDCYDVLLDRDIYLTPNEMMQLHLIDEII